MSGHVHVSRIEPNPANVRDSLGDLTELADSIRVHGILQPLVVQAHPDRPGTYLLLAGHRRLAAAKRLRLDSVPVTIRKPGPGDQRARALEIMLVENCQRRDLGPVEKAEAMGALLNHGLTAVQIARRTGISQSTVSYHLALLELDEGSRARVAQGTVKVGDAIRAVRKVRKQTRGGTTGRKVQADPPWFTRGHRLARTARDLCDAQAHTGRPQVGEIACGQCWEQAIRDDDRAQQAPDPEPQEPFTARQERMELLAGMRLHDGPGPPAPGVLSAREAGERLGVTSRTVERYKAELAPAGAS